MANAHLAWKAEGKATDYTFTLSEQRLVPGEFVPLHSHAYPEVFYVTNGPVTFHGPGAGSGGGSDPERVVRCETGTTIVIPTNAVHGFRNDTDEARFILSISTYLHQTFFDSVAAAQERGELAAQDMNHVMEKVAAIGRRHKMYFVPPEGSD